MTFLKFNVRSSGYNSTSGSSALQKRSTTYQRKRKALKVKSYIILMLSAYPAFGIGVSA